MQRPLFLLVLAGCSGSGTVYGDILVKGQSGEVKRAARVDVMAIPSSDAFEREWGSMLAAFREELDAARDAEKRAASWADEARLAWDKALAARLGARARGGRWSRHLGAVRAHDLWWELRTRDEALFKARQTVWEVARKHELVALSLLGRHRSRFVQTDGEGRYVLPRLPVGKSYLYARVRMGSQDLAWFRPVQVSRGAQQVDLTEGNRGNWPFVP